MMLARLRVTPALRGLRRVTGSALIEHRGRCGPGLVIPPTQGGGTLGAGGLRAVHWVAARRSTAVSARVHVDQFDRYRESWPLRFLRRLPGIVLKSCLTVLALAVLAAAVLPSLLSTRRGLAAALDLISATTPAAVSVEHVRLGWTKPIDVADLTIRDKAAAYGADPLVSVGAIRSTSSLWGVLRGQGAVVTVEAPALDASLDANGVPKLAALCGGGGGPRVDSSSDPAAAPDPPTGPHRSALAERAHVELTGLRQRLLRDATHDTPLALRLMLSDARVDVTADVTVGGSQLMVSDGVIKCPSELREMVGAALHVSGSATRAGVATQSEDAGLDAGWLADGVPGVPAQFLLDSDHLHARVAGRWQPRGGRLAVVEPPSAAVELTPTLAKYGLGALNPLLAGAVGLEEASHVVLRYAPAEALLPASAGVLRVAPLKIRLDKGDLPDEVLRLVLPDYKPGRRRTLQAWTTAMEVAHDASQAVTVSRADLLLSPGGKSQGVRVAVWGAAKPASGEVSMFLGIPPESLALAGVTALPAEDYTLIVSLSGALDHPLVNWREASSRIGRLTLLQAGSASQLQGGIVGAVNRRLAAGLLRDTTVVPPLTVPVPWEEDALSEAGS